MLRVEGVVRDPDVRVQLTVARSHHQAAEHELAQWAAAQPVHWVSDVEWTEDTGSFHVDVGGQGKGPMQALIHRLGDWCEREAIDAVLAFPPLPAVVLLACDGHQWDIVVDGVGEWLAPVDTPVDELKATAAAWLAARNRVGDIDWEEQSHPSAIIGRFH